MVGFEELFHAADALAARVPLAVVGAADPTVIEAVTEAHARGWIAPILVGRGNDVRAIADTFDVSLDGIELVDSSNPARAAVELVRAGNANMLMKGQVATPDLMQAILDRQAGLRTESTICQVVLMEVMSGSAASQASPRRFLLADTGVCIAPTTEQKIEILRYGVQLARSLGAARPLVAMMAATEKATDSMHETGAAAEIEERIGVGDSLGCIIQGPLSFDLAYAVDAAAKKRIGGPVVGAADIMLFPNLLSANLTVKAIMYTADCRFGGVLCGVRCPVVFMSRSDDAPTRLRSIALALRLMSPQ